MPKNLLSVRPPNQVRRYRKKKNLRIKDVAKLMELSSPSHVSHWEKGRKLPNLTNALKLAAITGCTVEILFLELYNKIRHDVFLKRQSSTDENNQITHLP